ncbi:hypothetical protein F4803DRAFT_105284 [Xylaria telfairii]|nr:hypothetical protein F4803DRAFT_105284 [Xylaria telfairii]
MFDLLTTRVYDFLVFIVFMFCPRRVLQFTMELCLLVRFYASQLLFYMAYVNTHRSIIAGEFKVLWCLGCRLCSRV